MFKEYFKIDGDSFTLKTVTESKHVNINDLLDKIRDKDIRVKTIIPTKFGTEIVFYSTYDADSAAKIIKTTEVDGKSIFVPKG